MSASRPNTQVPEDHRCGGRNEDEHEAGETCVAPDAMPLHGRIIARVRNWEGNFGS